MQFNEDSIYAFYALKAGYTVEYAADARVYHSHDLSFKEMFKRSKAIAASQKAHKEIFGQVSSEHEGMKFLILGSKAFLKKKDYISVFRLFITCAVKYAGYFVGKHMNQA